MGRQTTARVVGALFLTATAAGVASVVLLGDPPDVTNRDRATGGALVILLMCVAIAAIPAALFPVLKAHGESLALGYVVARTLEVVLLLPAALNPLLLLTLRDAGSEADPMRTVLLAYGDWGHPVSAVFFCAGAATLYTLLYRGRLVPRFIAGWGLLGVVPYLVDVGLVLFGRLAIEDGPHTLLILPLALNELVLAGWLLVKGFRPASQPA